MQTARSRSSGRGSMEVLQRNSQWCRRAHYQQPACYRAHRHPLLAASMRTEWMLARRPEGDNWIDRNARIERTDDEFLRLRESWCQLIEDQGMQYKFVSYDQLENGELLKRRISSLHSAEIEFIVAAGSRCHSSLCLTRRNCHRRRRAGTFNEHSRRLSAAPIADLSAAIMLSPSLSALRKGKAVIL